jgi:hypothetical protein
MTNSLTYYLYVKTHKKTKLKYLGITTQNPYQYMGSGVDWVSHLDAYGSNVDTEVLLETDNRDLLIEQGVHYSKLWNIVKSPDWANKMNETGSGAWENCNIDSAIQKRATTLKGRHKKDGLSDNEKKSYKTKIKTRLNRIKHTGFTKKEIEQHNSYGIEIKVITPSGDELLFPSIAKATKLLNIDCAYGAVVTSKNKTYKGYKVYRLKDPKIDCRSFNEPI